MSLTTEEQATRIIIMGATGSGKSTFINLVSGSSLPVSDGLKSCTSAVIESQPFTLDNQRIVLIDTPGFDDSSRSDTDIITTISTHLVRIYNQGIKLAGVIYMHRISDIRMGGSSRHNFCLFRSLCGDESLRHVLMVTTMWSAVNPTVGEKRERELASSIELFKPVIDQGAQLLRHTGTVDSAQAVLRQLIAGPGMAKGSRTTLRIQRELVDEGKQLAETTAGVSLMRLLAEQAEHLEARSNKLSTDLETVSQTRDAKTRNELQWEFDEVQKKRKRIDDENERLLKAVGTSMPLVRHSEAEDVELYNSVQVGSLVREQDQRINWAVQEIRVQQMLEQQIEQMKQQVEALVVRNVELMAENRELREQAEQHSKSFFQRFKLKSLSNLGLRWLD